MKAVRLTLTVLCLVLASAALAQNKGKDIVKSTHTIKGKLVSFEVGDYVHAIIKDSKGQERSFYIGGAGLDYYLAVNANKMGTLTYQVVNGYIEEAGSRMDMDRLISAKIGKQGSASWWKSQRKKMKWEELDKKYQPLVNKLTKNGG